jgi:hypothetical protein
VRDSRALPARLPQYAPNRTHLDAISDDIGVFQHAAGATPDPAHGYCVDDVARVLQVDLLHALRMGWEAVADSAWRNLRFLQAAFDTDAGRFRNFRSTDGTWSPEPASDDCQGRAIHALGDAAVAPFDVHHAEGARALFANALPATRRLEAPRAIASVVLGCAAVARAGGSVSVTATLRRLARRLAVTLEKGVAEYGGADWPWPEPALTYENALMPRALIVAGAALHEDRMRRHGLALLDWLIEIQTASGGHLSPVGNTWWVRGGTRGRFDQQPIEATSLLAAVQVAFELTGDARYAETGERAYAWFLGGNDLGVPVADPARGAAHDGLTASGVNRNQGAESTLMWLNAAERIGTLRAAVAARARTSGDWSGRADSRPAVAGIVARPVVALRLLPAVPR